MTMSVRPAMFECDSQNIVDTLQANLPQLPHAKYFRWLYLDNPAGRASVWVATNGSSDNFIGIAAAFPRLAYISGKEAPSHVLGDFCIDSHYRTLGLAISLQRACLEGLAADGSFAYDFPSDNMLAVYKRMQIDSNATMIRFAKPLRADRKISEHVSIGPIANGVSMIVNTGLRLRDRGAGRKGCVIEAESGPWGEEFTEAGRRWSERTGKCVAKTAQYLNWRYRQHPIESYEMLTARKDGVLRGYLVQHRNGDDCVIDDLIAEDDGISSALLTEATAIARKRHAFTVNAYWLADHPGCHILEQCGFHARESTKVVLMNLSEGRATANETSAASWHITFGDWER